MNSSGYMDRFVSIVERVKEYTDPTMIEEARQLYSEIHVDKRSDQNGMLIVLQRTFRFETLTNSIGLLSLPDELLSYLLRIRCCQSDIDAVIAYCRTLAVCRRMKRLFVLEGLVPNKCVNLKLVDLFNTRSSFTYTLCHILTPEYLTEGELEKLSQNCLAAKKTQEKKSASGKRHYRHKFIALMMGYHSVEEWAAIEAKRLNISVDKLYNSDVLSDISNMFATDHQYTRKKLRTEAAGQRCWRCKRVHHPMFCDHSP